jgi:hypothetical protein
MTHKRSKVLTEAERKNEWGLTKKQEAFCQIYVTQPSITQTEAAREAGYVTAHAAVQANHLLQTPHVVARIEALKADYYKKHEVTFDNHVTKLAELRDLAAKNGNYPAAVSAERYRGMAAGLYVDRKEILMGKIDQMSRDEVMKEIQRMQKEYPQLAAISPTFTIEAKPNVTEARAEVVGRLIQEDQGDSGLDED